MNNEPFHVMAHDWRYNSRQKALSSSLHLAQLPADVIGETVLIAPTRPETKPGGPGGFPMPVPPGPFHGNGNIITNRYFVTDVYGSVGYDGTITAQNKMDIQASTDTIVMTPTESGFYLVHVEGQSDLHTVGYQGPANDGKITVQIFNNGAMVAFNDSQLEMSGSGWTLMWVDSVLRAECDVIVYGSGPFMGKGLNLGTPGSNGGWLSMWVVKIADDV